MLAAMHLKLNGCGCGCRYVSGHWHYYESLWPATNGQTGTGGGKYKHHNWQRLHLGDNGAGGLPNPLRSLRFVCPHVCPRSHTGNACGAVKRTRPNRCQQLKLLIHVEADPLPKRLGQRICC